MKNYYPVDFRVVGKLLGANLNSTADQAIAIQISDADNIVTTGAGQMVVTDVLVTNASVSLTTAVGGVYTAASKSGAIVANTQVYSALTAATKYLKLTLTGAALTDVLDLANLYFSLTTAQGAAATADIYVYARLFQKN